MKAGVILVALTVLAGSVAADDRSPDRADDRSPDRADARATAERYFRAGAKAYAAQSFAAAVANFDEAYKALPMPEIAFSAAQAYRRLYRIDPKPQYVQRAVELYRVYLDKVKSGGRVGDAADSLGELERELDKLGARGAKLRVDIAERTRLGINVAIGDEAAPVPSAVREIGDATGDSMAGVTTLIDGKPVEPFALIDVEPGDHVIAVTADGYFPVEKTQRAVRGAAALVEVELRPRPAKVIVKTERGARITIDGRPSASSSLELAAGTHLLTILRPGREPFGKELVVTRGESLVVAAPLRTTPRRRAVPWVLGGAAVFALGAVTTATLAIIHDGRASDLRERIDAGNQEPRTADAYDNAVAARDDLRAGTWLLGGSAVVAGAAAALLYHFDTPSTESLRIAPLTGASAGGVTLHGRF